MVGKGLTVYSGQYCPLGVHLTPTGLRLITLDENPGVRPIGIGETQRRIIAKAALSVTKDDILNAADSTGLQRSHSSG